MKKQKNAVAQQLYSTADAATFFGLFEGESSDRRPNARYIRQLCNEGFILPGHEWVKVGNFIQIDAPKVLERWRKEQASTRIGAA